MEKFAVFLLEGKKKEEKNLGYKDPYSVPGSDSETLRVFLQRRPSTEQSKGLDFKRNIGAGLKAWKLPH